MNLVIATIAALFGLLGLYHCGRAFGSRMSTGNPNWSALRLAFFAGALGWCGLFAVQGSFWGPVAVWAVAFLYFMDCNHTRREGYALVVMAAALAASWWAYLKPMALVVAVGALAQ